MPSRQRMSRPLVAALALVTSSMLLTGCGTTAHVAVHATMTLPGKVPSRAEQAAALFATTSYRRQVVQAAEGFTTSVTELDGALRRGDRQAAKRAWAAAQGSFDLLRPVLLGGPASSATYDGQLLGGVKTRGEGLHAIERALFQGPLSDGLAAMPDLKAAGPQLVIGLFRTIIQPSGVAVNQVHALGFLADHVIANSQERVSHRDLIDVLAIAHAVRGGLEVLTRLMPSFRRCQPVQPMHKCQRQCGPVSVDSLPSCNLILVNSLARRLATAVGGTTREHVRCTRASDWGHAACCLDCRWRRRSWCRHCLDAWSWSIH